MTKVTQKILVGLTIGAVALQLGAGQLSVATSDSAEPRPVQQTDSVDVKPLEIVQGLKLEVSEKDVTFNKVINGDALCASSTRCVVDGVVEDDALVAAMTVEIRGEIKGDLRAAAKELVIESGAKINGNVSIFAPTLTIKKGAVIGKDVVLLGTTVRVEGWVGRDLIMSAEDNYLEGRVGRNVEIKSSKHTRVAAEAKIAGHLFNTSATKDIAESAIVGEFKHQELTNEGKTVSRWNRLSGGMAWALSIGLLVLVVKLFRPERLRQFSYQPFKLINVFYIGIGYALIISLPIGAILMVTTLIGIPAAMLALIVWLLMLVLAIPLAIYYLANNTLAIFGKKQELLAILVGVVIYGVLNMMPVVQVIANLALVGFGAGLFAKLLIGGGQSTPKELVNDRN